ncbi:MAG TPA: hypothetical protein VFZ53_09520, partial [Polyangiaceae bacterium]
MRRATLVSRTSPGWLSALFVLAGACETQLGGPEGAHDPDGPSSGSSGSSGSGGTSANGGSSGTSGAAGSGAGGGITGG